MLRLHIAFRRIRNILLYTSSVTPTACHLPLKGKAWIVRFLNSSIIIENGKWIMENDCVAFGYYLNYFPEENTTIFNFQLSIFNSLGRAINRNRKMGKEKDMENLQKRVLEELAGIAFASFADHVRVEEGNLRIRSTGELDPKQLAAVASIEKSAGGLKVKLYDKLKALELLGKYLGLFDGTAEVSQADNGLLEAIQRATRGEVDTREISELQ